MTKYTDEQLNLASRVAGGCLNEYQRRCLAHYLRSDAWADIAAGVWAEPLDPIEVARREAREIAAKYLTNTASAHLADEVLEGKSDTWGEGYCAFTAICQERGLEVPE